ncbi:MAG: hypothetical protein L3J22_03170 [Xanthomonadales bacterium]|nr:hypothetical protein [Xanthomonadales bacterium]
MPEVSFIDQSNTTNTDIPVTFGQVFAIGDVPTGMSINVDLAGNAIATQVDIKATHPDGSLRHAVITTKIPTLGAEQTLDATLVTVNASSAGTVISAADLLATSFDTIIELTLNGVLYTASARDALMADSSRLWLEGSLVTEFTLKHKFKDSSGNEHAHLMARFDVRAYQGLASVRVDAIVENTWIYEPDPSNFTYDAKILVGGQEAYSITQLKHFRRARWHKVFWWGVEPKVYSKLDVAYLQATKAVPNYDPNVTVSESALEAQGQVVYEPMGIVELNDYMPEAGADVGIGPLPRWAARYLMTGDIRAYHGVLANGDGGGSYSTHPRKQLTDYPVSIDDHPRLGNNATGVDKPPPCTELGVDEDTWTCRNPYNPDTAHQPSIAYLPYLLTGDNYYLDELTFWATYNFTSMGYSTRGEELGWLKDQVRGTAWSLRTLGQTAYILPDVHPMKAYFNEKLGNNREWLMEMYVNNPDANQLGVAHANATIENTSKPWMDDFFTWSLGYLTELGFTDFVPILQWKSKYPINRMTSPDDEFCWILAADYTNALGPDLSRWAGNPDNWFTTMAQIYETTYNTWSYWKNSDNISLFSQPCGSAAMANWLTARFDRPYAIGEMYGSSQSPMGYPSNLQPALAVMVDAGIAKSNQAWTRLVTSASRPNYSSTPQFAVTPRTLNTPDSIFINGFED